MTMELSVEAIRRVYEARQGGFFLGVVALLNDPEAARDAVQEGFAQALRDRRTWRGGTPEAWIWRIIERKALDEIRRGRRAPSTSESFDAAELLTEDGPRLAAAISALSPRRRIIVFLHYYADLPYAEIARLCGISEGTVAATLAQARVELAEHLQGEVTR